LSAPFVRGGESLYREFREPAVGLLSLIVTALLAWTGSGYSVALYVLLSCVISIAAVIPLPDYTNRDISEEPVYGLAEGAVPAEASGG
jgi:hypothetical protein